MLIYNTSIKHYFLNKINIYKAVACIHITCHEIIAYMHVRQIYYNIVLGILQILYRSSKGGQLKIYKRQIHFFLTCREIGARFFIMC